MPNTSNQREFTRIATALDAEVTIAGVLYIGTTRDVSLKGLLLTCAQTPPSSGSGAVVIHLSGPMGGEAIRAQGTVVRSQSGAWAIEFSELVGVESYQHLTNLIRYNARDPKLVESEIDSHLGLKRFVDPEL